MKSEQIQRYQQWKQDQGDELDLIVGASRQIAHLAGVSLTPKGRWKKQGTSSVLKFSVAPKPLKWKGTTGWERMIVVIRTKDNEISFCVMIDGNPVAMAPNEIWAPVRKANHVIERATKKLERP